VLDLERRGGEPGPPGAPDAAPRGGAPRAAPVEVVPARGAPLLLSALARAALERRLVHLHTNGANRGSWAAAQVAARARLPGGPAGVLTLHSGLCPPYLAASPGRRRWARLACQGFGQVIAVSQAIADALHGCGVKASRIAVMPAFLGAAPAWDALPARYEALRSRCTRLFAAAVAPGPTYGEDLLLEAFRRVRALDPCAGLAVFGRGSQAGPAGRIGLAQGVLALGEVGHAEAQAIIGASDVFVRPTRADGDANSVREALALGRAVVASDAAARPAGCLVFRTGDAEDLAARMRQAAAAPPPATRPARVTDPAGELMAIYRRIAGERPIPRDSEPLRESPIWPR
jgi:glycosyltransferase involved in cell wall biosynthesis